MNTSISYNQRHMKSTYHNFTGKIFVHHSTKFREDTNHCTEMGYSEYYISLLIDRESIIKYDVVKLVVYLTRCEDEKDALDEAFWGMVQAIDKHQNNTKDTACRSYRGSCRTTTKDTFNMSALVPHWKTLAII